MSNSWLFVPRWYNVWMPLLWVLSVWVYNISAQELDLHPTPIADRVAKLAPMYAIEEPKVYAGIDVVGYSLYEATHSGTLQPFDPETMLSFGDPIILELYVEVFDRFDAKNTTLSLGTSGWTTNIVPQDFVGTNKIQIGGVYKKKFEIQTRALPNLQNHLPFFSAQKLSINFTVSNHLGVNISSHQLVELTVGPILDAQAVCLTANADIEKTKHVNRIENILYPDGDPTLHTSGTGTIRSELTDGIFSGSGIPEWETVFWTGNWGAKSRRVDFVFNQMSTINAVVAFFTSPYGDNWVDSLRVEVSQDGEHFAAVGSGQAFPHKDIRGLHALVVQNIDETARYVRLVLIQNAGATRLTLSEAYIFGK